MGTDAIVSMSRLMLREVIILLGPILLIAIAVSLIMNIVQVLTSLQDQTLSTVPRLLAVGAGLFFLMPWMWRQLGNYTIKVLSDFHGILN
jgi:flagellar biosynthesis protein FliQ